MKTLVSPASDFVTLDGMETRETIILDARAQHRLFVLNHVLTGGLTAPEAARVLGLSVRQVGRLLE